MLPALFYLEGDPAAGEDEAVLFRQQDTLLLLLPLASSRRLGYQRADGVSHITERRGDIYDGKGIYINKPEMLLISYVSQHSL